MLLIIHERSWKSFHHSRWLNMTPYCEIDDSGFELDARKNPTRLNMLRTQQFSLYFSSNIYLCCSRNLTSVASETWRHTETRFWTHDDDSIRLHALIAEISLRNSTKISRWHGGNGEVDCRRTGKFQVYGSGKKWAKKIDCWKFETRALWNFFCMKASNVGQFFNFVFSRFLSFHIKLKKLCTFWSVFTRTIKTFMIFKPVKPSGCRLWSLSYHQTTNK